MQQYYTLEEAARVLRTTPEELKRMAENKEIRAFRDRGNMRFRSQEIDEMARQRGFGSDPELQLGEAGRAKRGDSPPPAKKGDKGVFDFTLDPDANDQVEIGQELVVETPSGKQRKPPSSKKNVGGPSSPPPKAGTDSDVRLVPDQSDPGEFTVAVDSDVKMVDDQATSSPKSGRGKTRPGGTPPSSSVRIVPAEGQSDSDVKMVGEGPEDSNVPLGGSPQKRPSDSDIRLEQGPRSGIRPGDEPASDDALLTEEIDLDAEQKKFDEASRSKGPKSRSKVKPGALPTDSPTKGKQAGLPADSPYEITDGGKKPSRTTSASSSDIDLRPGAGDSSPVEADDEDEAVTLGEISVGGGSSGINLKNAADSGISLEKKGSDKGKAKPPAETDSDSEFELSLEPEGASGGAAAETDSDSEFELSLDPEGSSSEEPGSSDSEFELTLDESGGLAPLEDSNPEGSGEKDIFETDIEVPPLDEESGSEAVALEDSDTDLESSDFEMALDEGDAAADEESGSQVVALEEDEVDESAETVSRPRRRAAADEDVEEAEADEEYADEEELAPAAAAAPAEWGALPAAVLIPSVLVLFFVGAMSFELIRSAWGFRQPKAVTAPVTRGLASVLGVELPK